MGIYYILYEINIKGTKNRKHIDHTFITNKCQTWSLVFVCTRTRTQITTCLKREIYLNECVSFEFPLSREINRETFTCLRSTNNDYYTDAKTFLVTIRRDLSDCFNIISQTHTHIHIKARGNTSAFNTHLNMIKSENIFWSRFIAFSLRHHVSSNFPCIADF